LFLFVSLFAAVWGTRVAVGAGVLRADGVTFDGVVAGVATGVRRFGELVVSVGGGALCSAGWTVGTSGTGVSSGAGAGGAGAGEVCGSGAGFGGAGSGCCATAPVAAAKNVAARKSRHQDRMMTSFTISRRRRR
jgi:hypothetical protein